MIFLRNAHPALNSMPLRRTLSWSPSSVPWPRMDVFLFDIKTYMRHKWAVKQILQSEHLLTVTETRQALPSASKFFVGWVPHVSMLRRGIQRCFRSNAFAVKWSVTNTLMSRA
jgi:hypothetical protein